MLTGSSKTDVMQVLAMLAEYYNPDPKLMQGRAHWDMQILSDYPAWALREAVPRLIAGRKYPTMPTAAEIIEALPDSYRQAQQMLNRCAIALLYRQQDDAAKAKAGQIIAKLQAKG